MAAVAAVIGRRFDFALLRSASGMEERDVAEAVEEMVRHHVLRTVGNQLEFTHDRLRDVAYDRLLPPRRRLLHAAVAEALEAMSARIAGTTETLPRDRPGEQIEQLAYHALRGDLREKAVHYLRQAADEAAARSALQNARSALEQALGILKTLPESRSTWEQAFEIRLALRPVLVQLGELRETLILLREAEALAERLNDDGRRGQVCAFLTNIHSRLDEPGAALVTGTRALEIAGRLGSLRLRILATTYLEQAHSCRGEYARVIELARSNLAALPPEWVHEFLGGSQPPSVNDRFRLLVSLAHLGRFAEAAEHEVEIIRLAEATHHAYTVGVAYYAAGMLHLIKGEWAKARALIERQIAVLRAGNVVGELPTALAYSARAVAYLGDADEVRDQCREAERLLEDQSARGRVRNGWIDCSLGRARLLLGQLDAARRLARHAVGLGVGSDRFPPRRAAAPRRHRDSSRRARCGAGPGLLRGRAGARRGARHAAPRRPLPSGSREASPRHRRRSQGARASRHGRRNVPRNGHALLAARGKPGPGNQETQPVTALALARDSAPGRHDPARAHPHDAGRARARSRQRPARLRMVGAVRGIDPKTGQFFDPKRCIDASTRVSRTRRRCSRANWSAAAGGVQSTPTSPGVHLSIRTGGVNEASSSGPWTVRRGGTRRR